MPFHVQGEWGGGTITNTIEVHRTDDGRVKCLEFTLSDGTSHELPNGKHSAIFFSSLLTADGIITGQSVAGIDSAQLRTSRRTDHKSKCVVIRLECDDAPEFWAEFALVQDVE
jgi:hypothetical protein